MSLLNLNTILQNGHEQHHNEREAESVETPTELNMTGGYISPSHTSTRSAGWQG